jgi:DNA-binding transcriptional LysR family regulator
MAYTPLNSLNAFVAVARRRSFAAAARELGISSSALSPPLRAFVDLAREMLKPRKKRP